MSDETKSTTQRRREAREAARRLRNDPRWNAPSESPMEKLQQLDQQARDEQVFAESEGCEACATAREESGDDTALCDKHLAAAMGFG